MTSPESPARTADPAAARRPLLSDPAALALALTALVVLAVAPVLRSLYPILYVIGEDWSYPGVGAVGLLLYCAPLLAVAVSGMRPGPGVLAGAVTVLLAVVLVVAVHPISRWAAGAATVLALAGATAVLMKLAASGVPRLALLAGFVTGLGLDTAQRGALRTWDLVWRPELLPVLVALVPAILALLLAWVLRSRLEPTRLSMARRSAVWGLGGFVALQVVFLQSPGFVGSQAGLPFWAGVLVVLVADACALAALLVAGRVATSTWWVLLVALVALLGTSALPSSSGALVAGVVTVTQVAMVLLVAVGFLTESPDPARLHRMSAPARAAGAATFALLVIFVWQFYIDTPLPFPRWVIPLLGVVAATCGALVAPRAGAAQATPVAVTRLVASASAVVLVLAAVVSAGLWLTRPGSTVVTAAAPTLRVMTYNIRSAADTDGQIRPDVIAEQIRTYEPDVVVLQEVGRGWAIHAGTDVAAFIEGQLGLPAVFRGAADPQFGNVILSRLPMTTVSTGPLPDVGGQDRSYIAVEIEVAGTPVLVVGSHLEDRSVAQIEALRAVVGTTTPAVIAGDLNLHPDEPEVSALEGLVDVVEETGDRCRPSSAQPIRPCDRPDWILLSDGLSVQDVRFGTVPASDHLPLVATLGVGTP